MTFVDVAKPFAVRESLAVRRIAALIPTILIGAALAAVVDPPTLLADDDKRETVRRDRDADQPRKEAEREREGVRRDSDRDQPRREGDREREGARRESDQPRREGERERGASDFRPQNDREAMLFRLIQELRREVEALKREIRGQDRGVQRREGEPRRDAAPRDGDARSREGSRERDQSANDAARRKALRIFAAYDKNKDKQVVFDEWVAMKEGAVEGERLAREKQWFGQADRSGDERLSLEEFFAWMNRGRAAAREGAPRGPREGEGARREGARDGDRPREDAREGDQPREGDRSERD